jgi:hypothetical protein
MGSPSRTFHAILSCIAGEGPFLSVIDFSCITESVGRCLRFPYRRSLKESPPAGRIRSRMGAFGWIADGFPLANINTTGPGRVLANSGGRSARRELGWR